MTVSSMQGVINAVGGMSGIGSIGGGSSISSSVGAGIHPPPPPPSGGLDSGNYSSFQLSPTTSPTRKQVELMDDQESVEMFGLMERNRTEGKINEEE